MTDDSDPLDAYDKLPPHDPSRDHIVEDDWLLPKFAWQVDVRPIEGFRDDSESWHLGWIGISKTSARHDHGFGAVLCPEARFYKRWFDFAGRGPTGWAIIFRLWDRSASPSHRGLYETPAGWVPPEREQEADHWIAFLNQEIRARLLESGQTPKTPTPEQGAIPPPAPTGPVPVPRRR